MKIALCTPFKPLDHDSISGDVTIGRDLVRSLEGLGHSVLPMPYFPARGVVNDRARTLAAQEAVQEMIDASLNADCWLTYGTYYKVPDLFGPVVTSLTDKPYFLLQASYAANRAKNSATLPGYRLNKRAMLATDHVFCNRQNDMRGCAKILPQARYSFIAPGLPNDLFKPDEQGGAELRQTLSRPKSVVVLCTAIMREGVKTEGVRWTTRACATLVEQGLDITLLVAGDGPMRKLLEQEAAAALGDRAHFIGLVEREELSAVYSAADMFAYPGLEESIGMVYLEAQQCGLPVVATDDEGAPMVVKNEISGLITKADETAFTVGIKKLAVDAVLRDKLGRNGPQCVAEEHDSLKNYRVMAEAMERIVKEKRTL